VDDCAAAAMYMIRCRHQVPHLTRSAKTYVFSVGAWLSCSWR
jgi:hypothetical protein